MNTPLSRDATSLRQDEPRFIEQGLRVYAVSDYEFVAAATDDEAVTFILKEWGYDDVAHAERDGCFERDEVSAVDLDKNLVNTAEEGEPKVLVTYRESLKQHIAEGAAFPLFFAGIDA